MQFQLSYIQKDGTPYVTEKSAGCFGTFAKRQEYWGSTVRSDIKLKSIHALNFSFERMFRMGADWAVQGVTVKMPRAIECYAELLTLPMMRVIREGLEQSEVKDAWKMPLDLPADQVILMGMCYRDFHHLLPQYVYARDNGAEIGEALAFALMFWLGDRFSDKRFGGSQNKAVRGGWFTNVTLKNLHRFAYQTPEYIDSIWEQESLLKQGGYKREVIFESAKEKFGDSGIYKNMSDVWAKDQESVDPRVIPNFLTKPTPPQIAALFDNRSFTMEDRGEVLTTFLSVLRGAKV